MAAEREGPVAGIVLAAGTSSRLGRNKLLLELGGESVVRHTVRNAIEGGLTPVLVVLGFEAGQTRDALTGLACEPVDNPEYALGINRSLQVGLAAVPPEAVAAVVLLADMPLVTGAMITAVVRAYRRSAAPLVISQFGEAQAPPTLYDRSLFGAFREREGEGAGKRVVTRHRQDAVSITFPPGALVDLDRPDDYRRLQAMFADNVRDAPNPPTRSGRPRSN
ncbi:MAG: nucleotidyltransferase family protein [Gemmatimonadota bacterium]|nr:nucleotidyltransferase family protein [Gemmatimonadota bacterium]